MQNKQRRKPGEYIPSPLSWTSYNTCGEVLCASEKPACQPTPPLLNPSGSKCPRNNISSLFLPSPHFPLPLMHTSMGFCLSNKLLAPYLLSHTLLSRGIKLQLWPAMPRVSVEQEVVQVVSSGKVLVFCTTQTTSD